MTTFEKTPSVLSFKRVMEVTHGVFSNVTDNGETPLHVVKHGIRCTQNIAKNDKATQSTSTTAKPDEVRNLQKTDSAFTSSECNLTKVDFGVRFLPLFESLHNVAGDKEFKNSIVDYIVRSVSSDGLKEVANCYARNIAGARWLWRNRVKALDIKTTVKITESGKVLKELVFDSLSISTKDFNEFSHDELTLGEYITQALKTRSFLNFEVDAVIDFGVNNNTEVFPSQLFVDSPKSKKDKSQSSRRLFCVNVQDETHDVGMSIVGQAALRDAKIANAIRTIDTWYDGDDIEECGPIPVEPTGANLTHQKFMRSSPMSSFSLIKQLDNIDPSSPEGMFMIACFIRGGVYSS